MSSACPYKVKSAVSSTERAAAVAATAADSWNTEWVDNAAYGTENTAHRTDIKGG